MIQCKSWAPCWSRNTSSKKLWENYSFRGLDSHEQVQTSHFCSGTEMIKGKSCGSCWQQHFLAGLVGVLGRLASGWQVQTLARVSATTSEQDSFDLMQELGSLLRLKNVHQLFWAGLDVCGHMDKWSRLYALWWVLGRVRITPSEWNFNDWMQELGHLLNQEYVQRPFLAGLGKEGFGLYLLKETAMI